MKNDEMSKAAPLVLVKTKKLLLSINRKIHKLLHIHPVEDYINEKKNELEPQGEAAICRRPYASSILPVI